MKTIYLIMLSACGVPGAREIVFHLSADTGAANRVLLRAAVDDFNAHVPEFRIRVQESDRVYTVADYGQGINVIRFVPTDWSAVAGVEWGVTYSSQAADGSDQNDIELDDFAAFPPFWFCTQLAADNSCVGAEEKLDHSAAIASRVIVHEFGHAIGLRYANNVNDVFHSPDAGDIMFAYVQPDVIMSWDTAAWQRFGDQVRAQFP